MIYLLVTFAGIVMIFAGIYFMSLGFSTPPDISVFVLGLILFVPGLVLTLLFGGRVELKSTSRSPEGPRKPLKRPLKKVRPARKSLKEIKKQQKPVDKKTAAKPPAEIKPKKASLSEAPAQEKTPQGKVKVSEPSPTMGEAATTTEDVKTGTGVEPEVSGEEAASELKQIEPEPSKATKKRLFALPKIRRKKDEKSLGTGKKTPSDDAEFVKERLKRLKKEYIENVDDVEDLLEDRLDSFKGAISKIRSEAKQPSIIWSFDASDVQDAMRETISSAEKSVVLMYPWIRNIDVAVLKKFMDTDSRLIIQEASLDDEASVELIKVLMDNKVQIRTMPHIHTVAAVSDDKNGLIISTDPIYESFEVGVIYKDEKSISEIKKLFDEAWNLSKELKLEGI